MPPIPHSAHLIMPGCFFFFITTHKLSFALKYHFDTVQSVCHPHTWRGRSTQHTGGNPRCCRGNLFEITLCSFYTSIKACSGRRSGSESHAGFSSLFPRMLHFHIYEKSFTDARCAVPALVCSFCMYIMAPVLRWGHSFAF